MKHEEMHFSQIQRANSIGLTAESARTIFSWRPACFMDLRQSTSNHVLRLLEYDSAILHNVSLLHYYHRTIKIEHGRMGEKREYLQC